MELDAEYVRNHSRVVLLVCDYYEMVSVGERTPVIDKNLALAPIMDIPIIRLILRNLRNQNFMNVVILGRDIESVVEDIRSIDYDSLFNLRVFKPKSNTLGGAFREMYQLGFRFRDFLVHYADYYTQISLYKLLKVHRRACSNLLTMYCSPWICPRHLNENPSSSLLYCDPLVRKIFAATIPSHGFANYVKKTRLVRRGPLVAALSGRVLEVFAKNKSLKSIDDFLFTLVTARRKSYAYDVLSDADFDSLEETHDNSHLYQSAYNSIPCRRSGTSLQTPIALGYLIPTEGMETASQETGSSSITKVVQAENYERGIEPSNEEERATSESTGDERDSSEASSGRGSGSESSVSFSSESSDEEEEMGSGFLTEATVFLCDFLINRKGRRRRRKAIFREFFAICSIWDATMGDILDVFVGFFFFILDLGNIEESIFRIIPTLGLLSKVIEDKRCQEMLMEILYTQSLTLDPSVRKRVFMGYGFLLVEERIVDREILRSYCDMYEEMAY